MRQKRIPCQLIRWKNSERIFPIEKDIMVQFIRKHSKEGEIDMKHLIIVKFKENVWARESEASREMLADIREIFDQTQQIVSFRINQG